MHWKCSLEVHEPESKLVLQNLKLVLLHYTYEIDNSN
jgi:hypothetical protein